MVQVRGFSGEKSRERGQGREEPVGGEERMGGAFWERRSAVWGVMVCGRVRRLGD